MAQVLRDNKLYIIVIKSYRFFYACEIKIQIPNTQIAPCRFSVSLLVSLYLLVVFRAPLICLSSLWDESCW